MKTINAIWEKRNLGVDAISFHIEAKDDVQEIIPTIKLSEKEYQTAIVNHTKTDILLELQKIGFSFIECTLYLSATAEMINVPKNLERFQPQMEYRAASQSEIKTVKTMIENNEVFNTDKIALDPFFGVKKSGIRYSFWIDDLLNSGKTLYAITFKNELIAFEIAGMTEGTVEYYLGGMLPSKTSKMLGAAMSVPGTIYWKNKGAKSFRTVVSSNNLPVIKLHQAFGFRVNDCKYVLIKHINNSSEKI